MACFVNFSNHPSEHWNSAQLAAAGQYGEVLDLPFPSVGPNFGERDVVCLAEHYAEEILLLRPVAVMCQGEFSLCFAVTQLLQSRRITVLCACSERKVEEYLNDDGRTEKRTEFTFVRFREYTQGGILNEMV